MMFYSMKRRMKEGLTRLLLSLLETEAVGVYLRSEFARYGDVRSRLAHLPNPYGKQPVARSNSGRQPIIISGRFRSGSTLLWNIFRKLEGHTAFYEPFNERRWFDQEARGGHTDQTHRGVSDYWQEYEGMGQLGQHYREDWIRKRLFMDETSFDHDMKQFIDCLVREAPGRPVLQFNRVDFRLPWLRYNYPDAILIHVYRNPRDQWCSVLRTPDDYPYTARTKENFPDRFYLRTWYRDLVTQFPFLERFENRHQYYLFYLMWKLSYCFGRHYSDVSVAMEQLTAEPRRTVEELLKVAGEEFDETQIDFSFVEAPESRWQQYAPAAWFEKIELECDEWLDDFFQNREWYEKNRPVN